ncbi:hypothetical protein AB6A40_008886 [Gnathostoma spinigerum]|uniref:Uncharacterized protein n=1 Tax=Gnathostoma spinigerum TaxID=75299 RepID=A0ABD6EZP4_9BILA
MLEEDRTLSSTLTDDKDNDNIHEVSSLYGYRNEDKKTTNTLSFSDDQTKKTRNSEEDEKKRKFYNLIIGENGPRKPSDAILRRLRIPDFANDVIIDGSSSSEEDDRYSLTSTLTSIHQRPIVLGQHGLQSQPEMRQKSHSDKISNNEQDDTDDRVSSGRGDQREKAQKRRTNKERPVKKHSICNVTDECPKAVRAVMGIAMETFIFQEDNVFVYHPTRKTIVCWVNELFPNAPAKFGAATYNYKRQVAYIFGGKKVYEYTYFPYNRTFEAVPGYPKRIQNLDRYVKGAVYYANSVFLFQGAEFTVFNSITKNLSMNFEPTSPLFGLPEGFVGVARLHGLQLIFKKKKVYFCSEEFLGAISAEMPLEHFVCDSEELRRLIINIEQDKQMRNRAEERRRKTEAFVRKTNNV